jgi:2-hydroxychromene-2-carboxylate isomerase
MRALPPVAPAVGITTRVRLGRDYYVRVAGNDYSVDPHMIGRFVDVHAGLDHVAVTCAGTLVASHQRCWATHQNITDPAHVVAAAELRGAYQARTAATRGPQAAAGAEVGQRSLNHYDEVFGLPSPPPVARPNLQVVR